MSATSPGFEKRVEAAARALAEGMTGFEYDILTTSQQDEIKNNVHRVLAAYFATVEVSTRHARPTNPATLATIGKLEA